MDWKCHATVTQKSCVYNPFLYFSHACSIEEAGTVTQTGGGPWPMTRVTRYQADGSSEELPNLNHGRAKHACGQYTTSDNSIVQRMRREICCKT